MSLFRKHGRPFMMTDTCMRAGCDALARYAPRLCIPVKGLAWCEPFKILIGLETCEAHFFLIDPRSDEIQSRAVRSIAQEVMKNAGAEPDFLGAYVLPVHVMSQEYRIFKREQRDGARRA